MGSYYRDYNPLWSPLNKPVRIRCNRVLITDFHQFAKELAPHPKAVIENIHKGGLFFCQSFVK